jgi:hypothetical protein
MRTIDAVWDEEALGVKSAELRCEHTDSKEALVAEIRRLEMTHSYLVVKVPVSQVNAMEVLPELGFKFCETLFSVERSVKSETIDKRLVGKSAGLLVEVASEKQEEFVHEQITGGVFLTDRVSLDKQFGPTIAAKRYWNWIQSEKELGAEIYFVSLKSGAPMGFFTLRVSSDFVAHSVLSGIFDANKTPGFGLVLLALILLKADEFGAKKIVSAISSNNLPVVRTHNQLGFEIKDLNYVFVRHADEK